MSKSIPAIIALTLIAFLPAPTLGADEKPKPETAWARRVFNNPGRADMQTLRDIVSAIAAEHAGILGFQPPDIEVPHAGFLGAKPRDIDSFIDVNAREGEINDPPSQFQITVHAHQPEVKKRRALELLDAITQSLTRRLEERMENAFNVDRADRDADEIKHEAKQARARLDQFEALIREKTGRVDASLAPIRDAVPKLEEQRQALKLEVIGKRARQQALAETIARFAKDAEERAKKDPVAEELEKVVKVRESALDRIRQLHKTGQVSELELVQAEVPVAEARAKLLERRETVAQTNGGELLSGLNRELATLSIDVAEAEAKLASLEKTLSQYGSVQGLLAEAEDARREWARLSNDAEAAAKRVREIRRDMPMSVLETVRTDTMAPDDPRLKDPHDDDKKK